MFGRMWNRTLACRARSAGEFRLATAVFHDRRDVFRVANTALKESRSLALSTPGGRSDEREIHSTHEAMAGIAASWCIGTHVFLLTH